MRPRADMTSEACEGLTSGRCTAHLAVSAPHTSDDSAGAAENVTPL